tara:strand:- start:1874 stop:2197 length:324 start_codon:yes stop_codon:yes gene_type:complete
MKMGVDGNQIMEESTCMTTTNLAAEIAYSDIQSNAAERRARFNKMKDTPIIIRIASRGAFTAGYLPHCSEEEKAAAVKWSDENPEYSFGIEAKATILAEARITNATQ